MEELAVALERTYAQLSEHGRFVGFAIHDYAGLRQMLEGNHGR
jgi:hypothetical protein